VTKKFKIFNKVHIVSQTIIFKSYTNISQKVFIPVRFNYPKQLVSRGGLLFSV